MSFILGSVIEKPPNFDHQETLKCSIDNQDNEILLGVLEALQGRVIHCT